MTARIHWRVSMLATAFPLGAAVFFLLILTGCDGNGEQGQRGRDRDARVAVTTAETDRIVHSLDATAEVVPTHRVEISTTVEGPLDFFPWREGDSVEEGEKLAEINRAAYRAGVKTAEASLAVAEANLADLRAGSRREEIEIARQNVREAEEAAAYEDDYLERVAQLVESGALAGEELDKARVSHVTAQARLEAARRELDIRETGPTPTAIAAQEAKVEEAAAKLEEARTRLEESVLTAPFDGVVTKVLARPGDTAAPRVPLLEMVDMNSLALRFSVPEAEAAAMRTGMPVTAQLDALPDATHSGDIVRVYPELNPEMRTRTVEAVLDNPPELAPNMFARVRVTLREAEDAIVLPNDAVLLSPSGEDVVYVIEDGQAQRRPVTLGIEESGRVEIVSGVEAGEQIAVEGNEELEPGMAVRTGDGEGQPRGGESAAGQPGEGAGAGEGSGGGGQQ
ncbi:MAG: efflux RND transporter periplasmic adaptor subunit [Candidatus Hydrogenedentota bacterium]